MNNPYLDSVEADKLRPHWALSCVICPLLVVLLYVAFRESFYAASAEPMLVQYQRLAKGFEWSAGIRAARTYWAATLYAGTMVALVLLASSGALLKRARSQTANLFAVIGALALFVCLFVCRQKVLSGLTGQQLDIIQAATRLSMRSQVGFFLALLFATAWVLACGVACEVFQMVDNAPNVARLIRVQRDVRALLATATICLIVGVVGIGAQNRMAVACSASELRTAVNAMGAAATSFSGVLYSALLAAIFGPAEVLLRHAGRRLAPSSARASGGEDGWLNEEGFVLSLSQSLLKILAIFSPLLAGLTQNIVDVATKAH